LFNDVTYIIPLFVCQINLSLGLYKYLAARWRRVVSFTPWPF